MLSFYEPLSDDESMEPSGVIKTMTVMGPENLGAPPLYDAHDSPLYPIRRTIGFGR